MKTKVVQHVKSKWMSASFEKIWFPVFVWRSDIFYSIITTRASANHRAGSQLKSRKSRLWDPCPSARIKCQSSHYFDLVADVGLLGSCNSCTGSWSLVWRPRLLLYGDVVFNCDCLILFCHIDKMSFWSIVTGIGLCSGPGLNSGNKIIKREEYKNALLARVE